MFSTPTSISDSMFLLHVLYIAVLTFVVHLGRIKQNLPKIDIESGGKVYVEHIH